MDIPVVVQHAPRFTPADALRIATRLYGLQGTIEALPSERDQNFRIVHEAGAFVLKIANATERADILDLQNAAMAHLAARAEGIEVPRVVPALDGRTIAETKAEDGRVHMVRLVTWVPGTVLARVRPHTSALLQSLGQALGAMDRAFEGFTHPAMNRGLQWDLSRTPWVRAELHSLADAGRRALVERVVARFEAEVQPRLATLRQHVIHNDWNDHNVLVSAPAPGREAWAEPRVVGAVDFGDMLYSPVVADLAVAAAYAMLDKPDPVGAAAAIVRGYHERHPLQEDELAVLFDLIRARLAVSVTMAACQAAQAPGNEYLRISELPAWSLLQELDRVSPNWAHYVFRHACGLPPCPQAAAVTSWLTRHRDEFASVTAADLRRERITVLDLSVGSLEIDRLATVEDVDRFSALTSQRVAAAGGMVGLGRYDEARLVYVTEMFRHLSNWEPENRTVHIGVDLFQPPGTPVFAPLAGRVHSFANNRSPRDYGPTIILEHQADEGVRFYTLYGHLDASALEGLAEGQTVARGQALGQLGDAPVNGGWPPHLHFQIVLDLLGKTGDFPGVAPPGEREVWLGLCPDPNLILGIPEETLPAPPPPARAILAARQKHLGRNLSVSYRRPLTIVRGEGQYLFDAEGRRFLDAVNNVPHVGHGHPRVAAAVSRQLAVLDTNTRYLHANLPAYLDRLCELLPPALEVCYLVNSGSEANELAIRLAHAATGRRGIVVVDGAYHGNTSSLVDISPYKFDGPGGRGCPPHVRKAEMPDVYRGAARAGLGPDLEDAGPIFARSVERAVRDLEAAGHGVAAFFCESLLSCGGQIVLPEGYLAAAYRAVRAAGGLCVADEVQVGFGRVGTHVWGFQTQAVVPDVVTMGKPIGNGFPLGAVVTTRAVADAFDTGMEYFNTFGGSPVACAAGLAVLDVMRDEHLQAHALEVGERLKAGLNQLRRFPLVGDVRGLGLFLGVEFVRDRETREPAPRQADYIVNRLRDCGILVSTDGPLHNVIKIKPPLPFTAADADRLVETLAAVLEEDLAGVEQA